jgi:polar amino acid transport system substrate-binding protein
LSSRRRWSRLSADVRRLSLLLVSCATAVVLSAQTTPPLILVSTEWPPFTNPAGQPRLALDLVETALDRAGLAAEIRFVPEEEFTRALLSGPFDGSAAAWRDVEREQALVFSQPYLENRLVLVARAGADVSAQTLGQLPGKRVAVVGGYAYGDGIQLTSPVFVPSRGEEHSLTLLLEGNVDYALMDDLVVHDLLHHHQREVRTRLQIGSTPLVRRELHLAVRRSRGDAASIVACFNDQLRNMVADRTYHRLLRVDWIRADLDGDGLAEYVPASDFAGPLPPQLAYPLFIRTDGDAEPQPSTRVYIGGTIYRDWASVPDSYKVVDPTYPDPRRSTASIFKFVW